MTLSRRRLLKLGAASAGLIGWPLLNSIQANAADDYPKRLLLVFFPNGTIAEEFWPNVGASANDLTLGQITAPLQSFLSRTLFLKGLDIAVRDIGPGGPHQKGVGGLFTNNQLQEGTFVDGDGSRSGYADGISVDQEVAKHIGQQSFLPSLELGVRAIQADVRARISYAGPGNPMPPVNSPLLAYERLFAGFSDIDEALKGQRRSVLDTVQQQYGTLTPRLSVVDQRKLEQHLELVRGIERRLDIAVNARGCAEVEVPPDLEQDSEETMPQIADLQGQLLTAAFACDLTRVASLQFSSAINDIRFPWLESLGSGHTLSHAGPSDASSAAERVRRQSWMMTEVAKIMAGLDAIPEGDGTVLDHTLILIGNELGLGNIHSHTDIPFVLAGGVGGFSMGRLIDFGGVGHGALLVTVLNAMGIDVGGFGHPEYHQAALTGMS